MCVECSIKKSDVGIVTELELTRNPCHRFSNLKASITLSCIEEAMHGKTTIPFVFHPISNNCSAGLVALAVANVLNHSVLF